jgi:hypothetical protein
VAGVIVTLPRQVLPGSFYKITRRCTQRQFLLRPDDVTNNVFAYCLGEAAERFEIDVLMTSAESNHHHTDIFDRHGNVIAFVERFHKLVAKALRQRVTSWHAPSRRGFRPAKHLRSGPCSRERVSVSVQLVVFQPRSGLSGPVSGLLSGAKPEIRRPD